ncbi:MAG: hypothetical protein M1821_002177 [Bathelium mastoideum]|nr:MAG: hypothetical protein M1821_002177 [Bathelium mastoideum]
MSKEAQSDEIQPIESAGTSDREAQDEELAMNKVLDDRITRKIDLHLVPIMTVMFMLAYLDRSNLGNAKIEGMLTDLQMVNRDYNVASLIFYVSYILFEVPSNILLRKTSPSTWLSVLLFFWGISALSQGLTQSYGGLVCARFFIGVFEAGFTPGFLYLFSMYYTRYQLQKRLSLMFASGIIAGAFSGLLAYALVKMDGVGGYAGWRWIFIIEGLATIAVALVSKFVIVDWPNRATFLSQEDKTRLMIRLEHDAVRGIARMDTFDATAFSRIVGDWKIYVGFVTH